MKSEIKNRIQKFIEKYLDSDIEKLSTFQLMRPQDDNAFGCLGRNFVLS